MRRATCVLIAMGVLLSVTSSLRAEVSRADIEEAIDERVQFLVAGQARDGRWPYPPARDTYGVGHTAVAVLALQQSGSKRPEVDRAIKAGVAFILNQAPEPQTYSAALVSQVLSWDSLGNRRRYSRPLSVYAKMLCNGQRQSGDGVGGWSYPLPSPSGGGKMKQSSGRVDNSNTQFAVAGLVHARKAGFQVPPVVWQRAARHYLGSQIPEGGWSYQRLGTGGAQERPTISMTAASAVSVCLCEEILANRGRRRCEVPSPNKSLDAAVAWIGENWKTRMTPYAWYACERLGMFVGTDTFGVHDWYRDGTADILSKDVRRRTSVGSEVTNAAFSILFLARGRQPVIINKLKRAGDWNLHRYDLKNLVEHISGPGGRPCQWRVVTLDASMDSLLSVPILWISGHKALTFTVQEKHKLKTYVEGGGTILGEACCSKPSFGLSFRKLVKELWPGNELNDIPKLHPIYTEYRKLRKKPALMGMLTEGGLGRLGVLYIPKGLSHQWDVGGASARQSLDFGASICLHVDEQK